MVSRVNAAKQVYEGKLQLLIMIVMLYNFFTLRIKSVFAKIAWNYYFKEILRAFRGKNYFIIVSWNKE